MKTTNELELALKGKRLVSRHDDESHVEFDGADYTVLNRGNIFSKREPSKKYKNVINNYSITIDDNSDSLDIIGVIIVSKQIVALRYLLQNTRRRFARDYGWNMFLGWLGSFQKNSETRKQIQFYCNDENLLLDSLLRNPHLDEDESIAYIKKASEIGFLITNFSPNGNCYHQFAKNRSIRILKELILKWNLNEAIQNVLKNAIEKKILEGENEQHL